MTAKMFPDEAHLRRAAIRASFRPKLTPERLLALSQSARKGWKARRRRIAAQRLTAAAAQEQKGG